MKKDQSLSCVGFHPDSSSIEGAEGSDSAINDSAEVVQFDEYQRIRDSDKSSTQWDCDLGEFVSLPRSTPSVRDAAVKDVARMLKQRKG